MIVTLFGMIILDREKHFLNAHFPILVIPSGMAMLVKELHIENARSHIIRVLSLTEYPLFSPCGAFNNFLPSLLYFTPHSSIKASFNSSSVALVDKSSIV